MTKIESVMRYKASLSVFRKLLKDGIITEAEFAELDDIIAEKYGIDLFSIYRENRLTYA
jgi:hypothetical protein